MYVLENVVDNAVRHARTATIGIDGIDDAASIAIDDDDGIAPGCARKIFETFVTTTSEGGPRPPICRWIARAAATSA